MNSPVILRDPILMSVSNFFVIGSPINSAFSETLSEFGSELSDFGTVWSAGRGSVYSLTSLEAEVVPLEVAAPEAAIPLLAIGGLIYGGVSLYQWLTRRPGQSASPAGKGDVNPQPLVGGVALVDPVRPQWFPRPMRQRRRR